MDRAASCQVNCSFVSYGESSLGEDPVDGVGHVRSMNQVVVRIAVLTVALLQELNVILEHLIRDLNPRVLGLVRIRRRLRPGDKTIRERP